MPLTTSAAGLGGRGHDEAARAHAEREHARVRRRRARAGRPRRAGAAWPAAFPYWMRLISGCGCSMRTPSANDFGFERDARARAASRTTSRGRVAGGEHARPRHATSLAAVPRARLPMRAGRRAACARSVTRAPKRNCTPRCSSSLAHAGDHLRQAVAADVRARVGQDRARRAVARQDFDHVAHVAALVRARVELAVAVRARPALAEAVVAVGVDLPAAG